MPDMPTPQDLLRIPIEERNAIHDLISLYNHAIDGGDPDGVTACFIRDGTFEGRSGRFEGHQELRKLGMTLTSDNIPRHVVSNVLIWPNATDLQTACVKSHLLFYEVKVQALFIKTSGVYDDIVTKEDGIWKFKSRKMSMDIAVFPE